MNEQASLFALEPFTKLARRQKPVRFHGADLEPADVPRLTAHLLRFIDLVSDRKWRTLSDVAKTLGMMETSASARWRQIKELGYTYEKKRDENQPGVWFYRVTGEPGK